MRFFTTNIIRNTLLKLFSCKQNCFYLSNRADEKVIPSHWWIEIKRQKDTLATSATVTHTYGMCAFNSITVHIRFNRHQILEQDSFGKYPRRDKRTDMLSSIKPDLIATLHQDDAMCSLLAAWANKKCHGQPQYNHPQLTPCTQLWGGKMEGGLANNTYNMTIHQSTEDVLPRHHQASSSSFKCAMNVKCTESSLPFRILI